MNGRVRIRSKRLQRGQYIIYEVNGRRTYLVYSRKRKNQIMKAHRKYGYTPF